MLVKMKKVNFLSISEESFKGSDGKAVAYFPCKLLTPDDDLISCTADKKIFDLVSETARLQEVDVAIDIRTIEGKMKTKLKGLTF